MGKLKGQTQNQVLKEALVLYRKRNADLFRLHGVKYREAVSEHLSPSDPLPPEGEKMPEDARKRTNATRKPMIDE